MSFEAMAWAIKFENLAPLEKFTLLMLANYASNENGDCYPSVKTLAKKTNMSDTTVKKYIKSLEDKGLLSIKQRKMEDIYLSNIYKLNLNITPGVGRQTTGGGSPDGVGVGQHATGVGSPAAHNTINYTIKNNLSVDTIKPYTHFANAENGHDQHSLNMSSDKSSQQYTADGNLKPVVEFKNDFDTSSHVDDSKSIESLKMTKKAKQEKSASRISDDWFLSDDLILQAQKISKQFNLLISKDELEIIGDSFKDYWLAKKGKDAEKMNWDATWRNWMRTDMLRRVEKAQPKIVIHKQQDILEKNRKVFEEFERKQENRGSEHREYEINPIDVMLGLSKT